MLGRVPNIPIPRGLTIMDMNPMNNNISRVVNRNARPARNVHAGPSPVNSLVRVHHQLLLQLDNHVPLESYPKRLVLDNRVPKRPGLRVHGVIVPGIGDHVNPPVLAAQRVLAEPDRAVREALARRVIDLSVYVLDDGIGVLVVIGGGRNEEEE
nr:hypothetical protein CFOL_v3_00803 [Ipomoea batatas]